MTNWVSDCFRPAFSRAGGSLRSGSEEPRSHSNRRPAERSNSTSGCAKPPRARCSSPRPFSDAARQLPNRPYDPTSTARISRRDGRCRRAILVASGVVGWCCRSTWPFSRALSASRAENLGYACGRALAAWGCGVVQVAPGVTTLARLAAGNVGMWFRQLRVIRFRAGGGSCRPTWRGAV